MFGALLSTARTMGDAVAEETNGAAVTEARGRNVRRICWLREGFEAEAACPGAMLAPAPAPAPSPAPSLPPGPDGPLAGERSISERTAATSSRLVTGRGKSSVLGGLVDGVADEAFSFIAALLLDYRTVA